MLSHFVNSHYMFYPRYYDKEVKILLLTSQVGDVKPRNTKIPLGGYRELDYWIEMPFEPTDPVPCPLIAFYSYNFPLVPCH